VSRDDYDLYEKVLLDENPRAFKRERNFQTKQDRSKYKKTDQKKEMSGNFQRPPQR
jgi:hypothetical protein